MKRAFWMVAALGLGLGVAGSARADVVYYGYAPFFNTTVVNTIPQWQRLSYGGISRPMANYPVAGLNSPAIGPRESGRTSFSGNRRNTESADKGTRNRDASTDLENIMRRQALVNASVVKASPAGVTVRLDDQKETVRYAVDQVFFFRSGDLVSARNSTSLLQPGDRVLVPQSNSGK